MKTKVKQFLKNEEGQGMVEYGLILILVSVALIGALNLLGSATGQLFHNTLSSIPS